MNLEERCAHTVYFGIKEYGEILELQETLKELRKNNEIPDTILYGQHFSVISFGNNPKINGFSKEFLNEMHKQNGKITKKNITQYLHQQGIDVYDSSEKSKYARSGGSAYIGPGQLVVYPVVDYEKITGIKKGQTQYKERIDQIIIDTLHYYHIHAKARKVSDLLPVENDERKDRKDVWVEKEKPYKIGAKAIRISNHVASQGFSIYVTKEAIIHCDKILICGYTKEQLGVTTIEHERNTETSIQEVIPIVFNALQKRFHYKKFEAKRLQEMTLQEVHS